ncbi:molybdate transport system regulatory protein [Mucilaginibacter lappiensis]|uniref:Molybdate transport system regulatory protein n=1 Tax=Mucilaginibacter lappiensis TaxID=354630 RepID=A0ABR6PQM0_9SPHI|nr:winged helix-turn-helix domain-containing protein [Mucilaginibacter lappiensis]MBB6110566.1 molybdate transport system regulatory protein [Mucilaginibacter lappiensis]SIR41597.1 molybdate transport system regulatory protein [Mucilaginibacter lappiensis]
MSDPIFKLNGRVWIEIGDEKVLGHGRVELLGRIQASGSIRQAALQMKMSYKQAWDLVNHMNEHFGQPLVISHRGGRGGGNAVITEYGIRVIGEFHLLHQKLQEFLKDSNPNIRL